MKRLLNAWLICGLSAFTVQAAVDGVLFGGSAHYKVQRDPISVCIADLNNDGINDMACANNNCDSISVLIGKGDGDYYLNVDYYVGSGQYCIEAANIDDDADIDLIVTTYSFVYTLDNAGGGNFGSAVQVSGIANTPWNVRPTDVDNDGDNDLIVAHNDGSYDRLSVWDNDGFGSFTFDNDYIVGTYQQVLAVADFNGDTYPDIAVGTGAPDFSVLLNNQSGGFTVDDTYTLAASARGMCAGNFDGGADIEIAITRNLNLTIYTNDGSGNFSVGPSRAILGSGYGITAADLDGANGPDLAMVDDSVEVYYNDGSGAFASTNVYWVGEYGEDLAIGKLDGDEYYDLAVLGWPGNSGDAPGHIAVLLNSDGSGQFMYPLQTNTGTGRNYIMSLCMADFNADDDVDIATLDYWNDSVLVYLGDGAGHFTSSFRWPIGNYPYEIIAADVDAQNTEDLIIGHSDVAGNRITVLLSNGDGTFGAPSTYVCSLRPRGIFVAELNGTGLPDIAVINQGYLATPPSISVLFNMGGGIFGAATNYAVASAPSHSAIDGGDFNGDGDIDLVIPDAVNDCAEVFYNNGSGIFSAGTSVGAGDVYDAYQVCVDDLDNNGYDDIIVGNYDSSEVCVMMYNGTGWDPTSHFYAGFEQLEIDVSDFDADGKKDIVVLNTESYNFSILSGDGAGGFSEAKHYGITSDDSEGLAIADFDSDGYPDVDVSNYNHHKNSVFSNRYSILTPVSEIVFGDALPERFMLSQNYPNPFNPTTTIQYRLPLKAEVTISIYNLLGQRVKVFLEGVKAAGTHRVVWDGNNNGGQQVSTGVYFYQMKAGDFVDSRKMVLLK